MGTTFPSPTATATTTYPTQPLLPVGAVCECFYLFYFSAIVNKKCAREHTRACMWYCRARVCVAHALSVCDCFFVLCAFRLHFFLLLSLFERSRKTERYNGGDDDFFFAK